MNNVKIGRPAQSGRLNTYIYYYEIVHKKVPVQKNYKWKLKKENMRTQGTQTINQHLNIADRETVQTKHTRSDEQQFQYHLRQCSVFRTNDAPTESLNILVSQ